MSDAEPRPGSPEAAALAYAARGWAVVALHSVSGGRCSCGKTGCHSPGKHPRTPHGLREASCDTEAVQVWWSRWPGANVGIRTGSESGLLVVDIDFRHGGDASLDELLHEHGVLPETVESLTGGGGRHLLFRWPVGRTIKNRTSIRPGLDCRAENGYVVAPPSVHVSGRYYTWRPGYAPDERPLADPPGWLLRELTTEQRENPAPPNTNGDELGHLLERAEQYVSRASGVSEGGRNNTAFSLAGNLAAFESEHGLHLSEHQVLDLLRPWNSRNTPPLSEDELARVVHSAFVNGTPRALHVAKVRTDRARHPIVAPVPRTRYEPFPVEVLPGPVAEFVSAAAAAIGCDACAVALPLLAGFASAIGNSRRLRLKPGWHEPAIVWTVVVCESGHRKSAAVDAPLEPVRKRQARAIKEYDDKYEEYEGLREECKSRPRRNRATDEHDHVPLRAPVCERFWCSDVTVEAMAVLMRDSPRGLLVVQDELDRFFTGFDAYRGGRGGDVAHWLEFHRGGPLVVDRKGGETRLIYVPRASVSLTGTIQPQVLARSLGQEHFDRGLAARLLFAMPPKFRRRWTDKSVTDAQKRKLEAVYEDLYRLEMGCDEEGKPTPVDLPLGASAQRRFIDFVNDHGAQEDGLEGELAYAWSKLEGYAARLALVLHLVRYACSEGVDRGTVDEQSVEAGIALVRWFGNEAERVYGVLRESESEREGRRLIEWIQRRGGQVTARELYQRGPQRFRGDTEGAERALQELETAGLGHWQDVRTTAGGGRSTRVFVWGGYETPAKQAEYHGFGSVASTDAAQNEAEWSEPAPEPVPLDVLAEAPEAAGGDYAEWSDL